MDILVDKKVKTRKPHRCFGCNEIIPAKTEDVQFTTIANDGSVYTNYTCTRCEEWINKNRDYFECGEFYRGDIKEAMIDSGEWVELPQAIESSENTQAQAGGRKGSGGSHE